MTDKTNTPDEVVDLVDREDKVIGQATKREVNSNTKLIHREVAIIIHDNENRVLLQKRSEKKKVFPNYWVLSVAGHIPKGMTPEDAAHMELEEELGFDTKLVFIRKDFMEYPNETHFAYLYYGKYEGQKITIEKSEIQKVKFFSKKQFKKLLDSNEKVEEESAEDIVKFWKATDH